VIQEIQQQTAKSTIAHFQAVLRVIEQPGAFAIDR
jgi:hypothetical protein